MILDVLLKALLMSIVSIGICSTMWEKMIFEKLGDWIESKVGEWWAKPLGKCYICFSFWASLIACLIIGWDWWLCFITLGISATISLLSND